MKKKVQAQLVDARRDQILEAAATVFAEKGFHAATIKDIARAAEIADGTIYIYFKNKTALLLGIFERMKDVAMQNAVPQALDAPDFATFLRMLLQQPLAAFEQDQFALFRIVVSEIMVNEDLRAQFITQIFQPMLALDEVNFREQAAKYGIHLTDATPLMQGLATVSLGLVMTRILGGSATSGQTDALVGYFCDLFVRDLNA